MPLNVDQRARRSVIWGLFFFVTPIPALLALWYGIGATRAMSKVERARARMIIGGISLGLLGLALWAGLFCLSVMRARHLARDVNCASNLRQISLALINYAMSNHSALPDDLDVLVQGRFITTAKRFVCPQANVIPTAPTTQAAAKSYVYLGGGLELQEFATVPLLVDLAPHGDDGFNAAYGDGSVRKITAAEWRDILQHRLQPTTRPSR
jgi:prepilin-type processing-associated H-X9-DG protein